MEINKKNWIKYTIGLIACLIFRMLPFRPPNVEPILATVMPFSKSYGKLAGFLFAFLSMIIFDVITNRIGVWTFITATTYGVIGILSAIYFKKRKNNPYNYAVFAVLGTLAFDAITGLSIGPIFFHQSLAQSLIGQIPFTALHLVGNISFSMLLSPLIYRFTVSSRKLNLRFTIKNLKPEHI